MCVWEQEGLGPTQLGPGDMWSSSFWALLRLLESPVLRQDDFPLFPWLQFAFLALGTVSATVAFLPVREDSWLPSPLLSASCRATGKRKLLRESEFLAWNLFLGRRELPLPPLTREMVPGVQEPPSLCVPLIVTWGSFPGAGDFMFEESRSKARKSIAGTPED